MKLLKYMPLALIAAMATGCSEDGPDPDAIDPGSFFPSYSTMAYQKCAPNPDQGVFDNTFNVQICRTSNNVGETVGLAYSVKVLDQATGEYVEGSKNLFTVPEKFTYTTNEPMGYIPVVAHNELMEIHDPILLTLTILDDTTYGASTIEVEYQRVYPEESWTPAGTANMVDGWVMPLFGLDPFDYSFDCSFDINDADPLLFRLVNPYQSSMYFEGIRAYNIAPAGGRYYIQIDLNDLKHPAVLPSAAGFEMSPAVADWGMFHIANFEGYLLANGYEYDQMDMELEPEERSTFEDYVLNIPNCVFWIADGAQGPLAQGDAGQITFPPTVDLTAPAATPAKAKVPAQSEREINRTLAFKKLEKKLNIRF